MRHVLPALVLASACAAQTGGSGTPGVAVAPPPVASTADEPDTGGAYAMDGFSFVDDVAAGMPQPGARVPLETDLAFIAGQGVALLVSLTTEPVSPDEIVASGMEALHLPIVDMQPPTYEQQVAFVEEMLARAEREEPVGVHCTAGLGRTGTMLATWFVAGGLDAEAAMASIRALRPGSIETDEQEESVRAFAARWPSEG